MSLLLWQTICTGWFGQHSATGWVTAELCLCPAAGVCLDKCSRLVIICRKKLGMSKHEWALESCKNKHDGLTQTPACCLLAKCSSKLEQQKSVLVVPVVIAHTYVAPKTCILCHFIKRNGFRCVIRPASFIFEMNKRKVIEVSLPALLLSSSVAAALSAVQSAADLWGWSSAHCPWDCKTIAQDLAVSTSHLRELWGYR